MSKYTVKIFVDDSPKQLENNLNQWLEAYHGEYLIVEYAVTPESENFNACFSALVTYELSSFEKETVVEAEEESEEDTEPFVPSPLTGFDFFLSNMIRGNIPLEATTTQALPMAFLYTTQALPMAFSYTTQALPMAFSYTVPLSPLIIDSPDEEEKP